MIIDKIFHIADVHIRNYQRHTEYNNVFKRLYKFIKDNKTPGSIIYLAGDIVHQKTDLSPELVQMVGKFFKSCADLCPTIVICGNHDANLNNESRLDSLTPIIENLKHRKLFYWKDSGIYKISPESNISFAVFSVFDSIAKWPSAKSIASSDIKIALHHGAVMGATTDLDHLIENTAVTVKNFKGYDYGLLGDIHKQQYLNDKKTIAYSSSLIQQNYGESIDRHGLIVWDILNKTHEFVEIENDIAYATFQFEDNVLITDPNYFNKLPKYLRVKIKHSNTDLNVIHEFIDRLKEKHVFKEYSLRKFHKITETRHADLAIGNVRDIEYQNQLLSDFLRASHDEQIIDGCRYLNRKINSSLNTLEKNVKNTTWKLLDMEFSNMFSYGQGNYINFQNLSGIVGIFAPNATGKSSILEILTFVLYDKSSKTSKADEILNNQSDEFEVKVRLEIENEEYTIHRIGKANKDRKVRVDVNFQSSSDSLKGKDRDDTNKIIRSYIGTYDDFMLTALSTQTDNRNFIFKTQRERKDLLYSFLDLKTFTDLYYIAKAEMKDKTAVMANLSSKINIFDESEILTTINRESELVGKYSNTVQTLTQENESITERINSALVNIVDIPIKRSEDEIISDITKSEKDLDILINVNIPELKISIKTCHDQIDKIVCDKYDKEKEAALIKQKADLSKVLNNLKVTIKTKLHEIDHSKAQQNLLSTHEYDPNCHYCCNNDFVKSAKNDINNLPNLEQSLTDLYVQLETTKLELNDVVELLSTFDKIKSDINRKAMLNSNLETLTQKVDNYKLKYRELTVLRQRLDIELDEYKQFKFQFELNKKLTNSVTEWKEQLSANSKRIVKNTELVTQYKVNIAKLSEQLKLNEINTVEIEKLNSEITNYQVYCDAMSPNGIPYNILTKILPVIESEVNSLLSGITDFQVEFAHDEKSIYCNLLYGENRWPVELASGMERFLVSVASRIALIEVTSLSRPNFIAIDEGFGTLDSAAISNVYLLFERIKDKFDYMLCITHLDGLKDAADMHLNLKKSDGPNGQSYIYHN
jgi:DNA repair exonuclease SbcCD ATPase subunit